MRIRNYLKLKEEYDILEIKYIKLLKLLDFFNKEIKEILKK